jgi:hypothetical protein
MHENLGTHQECHRKPLGTWWEHQNLLKMQLRVNFQEGLLYHQEALNFEYPTHLANYYLATLTCGPLGEGKNVHHFYGGGGHLVLTDCIINYGQI